MKRYRNKLLCTLLVLAGLGAPAAPAQAGSFVGGGTFNGNDPFTGTTTSTVSFAVIDTAANGGASAYLTALAAALGGGSSVDTLFGAASGRYVYLYEVVNTSTTKKLGTYGLATAGGLYTSAGQITTSVFTNAVTGNGGGKVVIGTANGGDNGFAFGGTNSAGPVGQNSFVHNAGTTSITPDNASGVDMEPDSVTFFFRTDPGKPGTDVLGPGNYTTLLFLTANTAPILGEAQTNDTTVGASGHVPVASTPEPQTYALMSTGLLGLGAWTAWRRRFWKLA